jgi:hypothetical protein
MAARFLMPSSGLLLMGGGLLQISAADHLFTKHLLCR